MVVDKGTDQVAAVGSVAGSIIYRNKEMALGIVAVINCNNS